MSNATPRVVEEGWRDVRDGARRTGRRTRLFFRNPVAQFRQNVEALPFDYPASTVMLVDVVLLIMATAAVIERHGYFPSPLPFIAVALTYITGPLWAFFGVMPKPLIITGTTMAAVAVFLSQPVPSDTAPFILVAAAGEVAAIAPLWASIPIAGAMVLELLYFAQIGHLDIAVPYHIVSVLCGWMTGRLLQYQRRYLYQEREYQDVRAVAAADEERRRIAREVHDVIAHSLSVTLLHVTAARHALQTDRDVDEAVDALTDAERLGRQAMADIRRTVGLLDQRPSPRTAEPGLDDIEDLVADFVRAGMDVEYRIDGDTRPVSAGIGLALYRICQESLANIAKHAPGAQATLDIRVCAKDVTVSVRNSLPAGAASRAGRGMGISGMRQRTLMLGGGLSAGPENDRWHVEARIPFAGQPYSCIGFAAEESVRSVVQSVTRKIHDAQAVAPSKPQEGV